MSIALLIAGGAIVIFLCGCAIGLALGTLARPRPGYLPDETFRGFWDRDEPFPEPVTSIRTVIDADQKENG